MTYNVFSGTLNPTHFTSRHAHRSHRWTDFDDLFVIWRLSAQGCAFWGFRWYACPFRGQIPPKPQFWGRE